MHDPLPVNPHSATSRSSQSCSNSSLRCRTAPPALSHRSPRTCDRTLRAGPGPRPVSASRRPLSDRCSGPEPCRAGAAVRTVRCVPWERPLLDSPGVAPGASVPRLDGTGPGDQGGGPCAAVHGCCAVQCQHGMSAGPAEEAGSRGTTLLATDRDTVYGLAQLKVMSQWTPPRLGVS